MQTPQFILGLDDELIVDEFACGGGMSEAIEQAIGRHVDIAVNHDDDACSMHAANHPQTEHHWKDVFEVCPRQATKGRAVGLLHLSPDCTHHSQARGGQPRSKQLRGLAWVAVRWGGVKHPRIITLENVKQILQWGPLVGKRCPKTHRVVKLDGTVAAPGERVPVQQQHLVPDPARAGQTWRAFVRALERQGYVVEWRVLCAADYGTPTTRRRLFMVARCDGAPIAWPEPTHFKNPTKGQKRWRSAAECIDWSIPGRSIFEREKPLADATLRRVAHGLKRYVLDSADPYIVRSSMTPLQNAASIHQGHYHADKSSNHRWPTGWADSMVYGRPEDDQGRDPGWQANGISPTPTDRTHGRGAVRGHLRTFGLVSAGDHLGAFEQVPEQKSQEPGNLATKFLNERITASGGGQALAVGTLVQMGYGERAGQAPRALDAQQPLGTVVGAGKFAAVTAFVEQANGGFNATPARDAREPLSTSTASGSQQRLVTATIAQPGLTPDQEEGALRVAAFLIRYYGQGGQLGDLHEPMSTSTTKDRMALVTVLLRGTPYVIVDIQLRMLTPRELYNANGFPKTYIIDRGHDGRVFSKSTQVRMCGNAVPPPLGRAVIEENWNSKVPMRKAA